MLTCIIRYHIDPTKKAEYEQYARNWGQAIPRCGADLIGYFAPHEGSSTLAYGIYSVESLAAYVPGAACRRSARPRELRVRAAPAIPAARGSHLP